MSCTEIAPKADFTEAKSEPGKEIPKQVIAIIRRATETDKSTQQNPQTVKGCGDYNR